MLYKYAYIDLGKWLDQIDNSAPLGDSISKFETIFWNPISLPSIA